ncbi:hypothetical protein [Pseudomonas chlororaphis]|uniref:hypothetical protein n=1 Tax=Pseudomonas chlororaphis TaxID=587753 RepID=UPI001CF56EF0|nr:hypothetical protein [Pseudomonas chlororaphis]UCR84185.1 hypothetical protein K9V45_29025 [Pseudomonas chlororaphis]
MRLIFLLAPLILLISNPSLAVEVNITAEFKPDSSNPNINTFKNTTPISGYCTQILSGCNSNTFTLLIPGLRTEARPIMAGQADLRQGAMLKAPAEWRSLDVVSSKGKLETMSVRIVGMGASHRITPSVQRITGKDLPTTAHQELWLGLDWVNTPQPCIFTGNARAADFYYQFFWKTPTSGICGKMARFNIPSFYFSDINIMYELKTPNPLDLSEGIYTGQLNYTIGPGGDFDFGDVLMPSDNALTLNFSLSVQYILDVRFPPGSERLTLVPDGGWQQWLNRGRRPEKLFANQNFQIWSSTPFKMQLQCQHAAGSQCGIQNSEGHLVPVETRITLPSGLMDSHRMPVNRLPLSTDPSFFVPGSYISKGNAALHFEVSQDSVKQMTDHAGKKYSGNVTVIWDPEI